MTLLIVRLLTSFGNASKHLHGMGDHEYWGTLQNLLLKFVHFKLASLPFLFWPNDCLSISRLDSVLPYCMSVNTLSTDLLFPCSFYLSTSSPLAGCIMGHWWHRGKPSYYWLMEEHLLPQDTCHSTNPAKTENAHRLSLPRSPTHNLALKVLPSFSVTHFILATFYYTSHD